jgi:hypothetical protein
MNDQGQVIGIATMYLEGGQNLNFVVPVRYVKPMLAMGERPQRFTRAVLPAASGGLATVENSSEPDSGKPSDSDSQSENQQAVVGSLAAQMKSVTADLHARGFEPSHDLSSGALNAHTFEEVTAELDARTTYAAVVVCDDDCTDVDLSLYAPQGGRVKKDLDESDFAMVTYTPSAAGTYKFRVGMFKCSREPCGYALEIYEKQ